MREAYRTGGRRSRLLFSADLTTLTPGAATLPSGLTLVRTGTGASVRTGAATVATGIGANVARGYSDGTRIGLLAERAATNLISSPRSPQSIPPWAATSGGITYTGNYIAGPDGQVLALRDAQIASKVGANQAVAVANGSKYAGSIWSRCSQPSGTSAYQCVMNDGHTTTPMTAASLGQVWTPLSAVFTTAATTLFWIAVDSRDQSANGGLVAGAQDVAIDLSMVELGGFSTSYVDASRGDDLLTLTTPIVSGGKLALEIDLYPLATLAAYAGDLVLAYVDANNKIVLSQSTGLVTVTVGGTSTTLPFVVPTWAAFDALKLFVEVGGGVATQGWCSQNGTVSGLGFGSALGNWPSGNIHLLGDGTTCSFSAVLSGVEAFS